MDNKKNVIAIRIKELRKGLDLTQEELALKLGLKGKSSIANYESGNITPSDEIKLKMCKIFDCSMDYLMGITSYENPKDNLEKKLAKYNITRDEYRNIKKLLESNNYSLKDLLFDEKLPEKMRQIFKVFNDFAVDYCFTQMINTLDGEKTENNSIRFSNIVDDNKFTEQLDTINKIADLKFRELVNNLDENNFISENNLSKYYMCPVYGRISAGQPNWAEECIEGRLPIDPDMMNITNPEECFFLKVNGESMNKVVKNGAFALIEKTDFVENGEIAVVLVNSFDATLKKFSKQGDLIVLEPMSTDPSFTTQVYNKDTEIKVIGKYIGKMEMK